jgi:hypothetical protein
VHAVARHNVPFERQFTRRAHRYAARVTRESACRRAVTAPAAKLLRGSRDGWLVHLLEHGRLNGAQIARLRAAQQTSVGRPVIGVAFYVLVIGVFVSVGGRLTERIRTAEQASSLLRCRH